MEELTVQHKPRLGRIESESAWLNRIYLLFSTTFVSGFLIALPLTSFPVWLQINILFHVSIGTVLFIPLSVYIFQHFKRTVGIRRPLLIFSGLLSGGLILGLFVSGLWMAYYGQTENSTWIRYFHAGFAFFTTVLVIAHSLLHVRQKQRERSSQLFRSLELNHVKRALYATLIYFGALALLWGCYTLLTNLKSLEPIQAQNIKDYQYVYGDHPFRPSQTETSTGTFIGVEQIAKSEQCGACHREIYDQWKSSTHRHAASDPAYVKNINLLEEKRGISATRYCEGCHAPVALLTGELTPGGKHGGIKKTPAHNEGVGCLGCHGIADVVHTNGSASYTFDPKEHYLFDSARNVTAQRLRNFLIRLHPKQHKEAMGSDVIRDPKACATCHEQFMDESMNDWGWVKMQSEYSDWLQSPFSGQNEQEFQQAASMRCQDCHFPLVTGNDPSANANNQIRSHRSPGGNTFLPTINNDSEQFEVTKRFLQAGRLRVDIEEPDREDSVFNHQSINNNSLPGNTDNTPYFLYLGEQANLRVTVFNQMVGHSFPAGTTDLNQAWMNFRVSDGDNRTIYESGEMNENLELSEATHIYHTIPIDRQGKEVWRHDLFRMTGERYKNLIPAGGSDIVEYSFEVPYWAKQPITVTAILKYRKLNQRYARWVFNQARPVLPIVDLARDTLTIPLRTKPLTTKIQ